MAKSPAQASSTRDSREEAFEESKTQQSKQSHSSSHSLLHSSRSKNVGETSNKKAQKEKKKQRRLEHERARKDSSSAPATSVNTTLRKDLSQTTCYNCGKKGHDAKNCAEPQNDGSEDDGSKGDSENLR